MNDTTQLINDLLAIMNNGKEFEKIVSEIEFAIRTHPDVEIRTDVKLPTSYGVERQIDVLLIDKRGRHEIKTIIECKDTGRKVTLATIGTFKDLVDSVKAHQGIMVSSSGFQQNVVKSASEKNIHLYELSQMKELTDYLLRTKIIHHQQTFRSTEIVVSFSEKKAINKQVARETLLFSTTLNREVNLNDIIEAFINPRKQMIINLMTHGLSNFLKPKKVVQPFSIEINFPTPLTFANKDDFTQITGFRSKMVCELELNPTEIKSVSEYKDIVTKRTHAYVYDVDFQGQKFKFIDKVK